MKTLSTNLKVRTLVFSAILGIISITPTTTSANVWGWGQACGCYLPPGWKYTHCEFPCNWAYKRTGGGPTWAGECRN